jgi:hypothetical protein
LLWNLLLFARHASRITAFKPFQIKVFQKFFFFQFSVFHEKSGKEEEVKWITRNCSRINDSFVHIFLSFFGCGLQQSLKLLTLNRLTVYQSVCQFLLKFSNETENLMVNQYKDIWDENLKLGFNVLPNKIQILAKETFERRFYHFYYCPNTVLKF